MSAPARRAKVERPGEGMSVRRQCALLNVARSGIYRPKPAMAADDLAPVSYTHLDVYKRQFRASAMNLRL